MIAYNDKQRGQALEGANYGLCNEYGQDPDPFSILDLVLLGDRLDYHHLLWTIKELKHKLEDADEIGPRSGTPLKPRGYLL